MKIKQFLIVSAMLMATTLISMMIISCGEENGPNSANIDPEGSLVNATDCKTFSIKSVEEITSASETAIKYEFADGILKIEHINTAFNCCPGEITAVINIDSDLITIEAVEKKAGCHCICLYDLDYEVDGLTPGTYRLKVIEQYGIEEDIKLDFTIDLENDPSGIFSVPRNRYPWDIN